MNDRFIIFFFQPLIYHNARLGTLLLVCVFTPYGSNEAVARELTRECHRQGRSPPILQSPAQNPREQRESRCYVPPRAESALLQ